MYVNGLSGPFVFDDLSSIPNNPSIRRLWPVWQSLWAPPGTTASRRPVVNLSLAINYALGGLDVSGYHVFNVGIHILSALLLFGIVRRTLLSGRLATRYGRSAPWLSAAVAFVWIVHPLLTESVDYIVQRTELLMAVFFLLTLYCLVRGADSSHSSAWSLLAVLSCALGMGSKEVMGVAPAILLLYDRVFLSPSLGDALKKRAGLYAGLAATWLILLVELPERLPTSHAQQVVTPWRYALTQLGVIVHYLRLSVWPAPLVVDYGDWPVARSITDVLPSAAIVLALLAATVWAFRREPWLGFLGASFFLILAPTSSVVPIPTELAAERRMYLPLAAVIASVVLGGDLLLERLYARVGWRDWLRPWVGAGVVLVVWGALAYATIQRNEDYKSNVSLLSDAVVKRPNNARAHNNLGGAFFSQGRLGEAMSEYAVAARLDPAYPDARYNLGNALARAGRFEEAIAEYSEALRLNPAYAEAHNNLGIVLKDHGRLEEAIAHYTEALRLNPNYAEAHNNLGVVLASQKQFSQATSHYAEALRLKPEYAEAHNNWGIALALQGSLDEAMRHFATALQLRPDYADAHHNFGIALAQQGRLDEAVRHYREALRVNPSFAIVHYDLGLALARQGKVEEAARAFDSATRLDPRLRRPQAGADAEGRSSSG